jgi:hypothetical protein
MARLAWISSEGLRRNALVTYSRIRDNKEEYTEQREIGDDSGYFSLVKLVPKVKLGEDWWAGEGRVFSRTGAAKQDWYDSLAPFRVANIAIEDVYSGRVSWLLHRWNIPVKLRMIEDLERQEKAYAYRNSEISGAMAEEFSHTVRESDCRSMILPDDDSALAKYELSRAHGDEDRSDTNPYTRQKQLVKETFKDEYKKPSVAS